MSTLLLIATIALWIRSYWHSNQVFATAQHRWELSLRRGEFDLSFQTRYPTRATLGLNKSGAMEFSGTPQPFSRQWVIGHSSHDDALPPGSVNALGFGWDIIFMTFRASQVTATKEWHVYFPAWLIAGLAAVMPAFGVRAIWKDRRTQQRDANHLCRKCGYDLRATRDRCPECGTIPSS
jgi:hypothetical protein